MQSSQYAHVDFSKRLLISNFPKEHSEKVIRDFCECFGKVKNVELVYEKRVGGFNGTVNVDFETEFDAQKAMKSIMGMTIGDKVLMAKRGEAPDLEDDEGGEVVEVFRELVEQKPTTCLVLKNIVQVNENFEPEDYKELEFDVQDELVKYGKVVRTHVPRPPKFGDPFLLKGFGKVYVRFESIEGAKLAKTKLFARRFNDRFVEVNFYPEKKFRDNVFD